MGLVSFVFPIVQLLLAACVVNAERQLPAELQVDLIFPRANETYAPTQLFPIVFGINNLDAVWPLNMRLAVTLRSIGDDVGLSRPEWKWRSIDLPSDVLADAVGDSPPRQYFHIPSVNMTNGTTDSFQILWEAVIPHRCFANTTDPKDDGNARWSNGPGNASRGIKFHTAPGAQRPDIEAAANSCHEPDEENSTAVRITEVRKTYRGGEPCPVFETDVKPAKCAFKSAARELAANVSAAMLQEMRCEEGEWQTITAPCPRKESKASAIGFGVGWILLPIGLAAVNFL